METADIRSRLIAYIAPKTAETTAEITALDNAVRLQKEYEENAGTENIDSFTIGDYSAKRGSAPWLSPHARSYLENAGLIKRELPTVRIL